MGTQSTVFGQALKPVPGNEFDSLASAHRTGRKLRSMTRWSQFVALSLGQLAGASGSKSAAAGGRVSI